MMMGRVLCERSQRGWLRRMPYGGSYPAGSMGRPPRSGFNTARSSALWRNEGGRSRSMVLGQKGWNRVFYVPCSDRCTARDFLCGKGRLMEIFPMYLRVMP